MSARIVASLCLAASLAGCATGSREPRAPEFVGRSLRVETSGGQVSTLRFSSDGIVVARFGERETQGRWTLERGELCFTWRQTFRECWPHTERFREGRTVTITSDRGNVVQVTML